MSNDTPYTSSVDVFVKRRLITEVLDTIASGKEATVYRCRAHPQTRARFYALKIHRPIEQRAFKNDSLYHHGRVIVQTRMARAFAAKTSFGYDVQSMTWIRAEYQTLRLLWSQGASVPEPIAGEGRALLMQWIGEDEPAPTLAACRLDAARAQRCLATVLDRVALWLQHNRVHADLSGFTILYYRGTPVMIDFPQSVDPRTNANRACCWIGICAIWRSVSRVPAWPVMRQLLRTPSGSDGNDRCGDPVPCELVRILDERRQSGAGGWLSCRGRAAARPRSKADIARSSARVVRSASTIILGCVDA